MVHRERSEGSRQPAGPGKVATPMWRMRLAPATKREANMSTSKLLFLTNAEQADAFARLLGAAERGDGDAACRLGDMYRESLGGLRYSPKQTLHWYSRSALAGDANGQNNLGACYEHGLGCQQSYAKAVKWYRLAAAQRLGTASMNLGYCYLHGHGVPAEKGEALRLFQCAVEQGEEKARQEVERLEGPVQKPKVRFVDATAPGRNFGLVGVGGVAPWEDEQIRLELFEVLKSGNADHTAEPADVEATDEELFPIYAECGLKPDDFIEDTSNRYAAFLADGAERQATAREGHEDAEKRTTREDGTQ
jgi:hypothetical protein